MLWLVKGMPCFVFRNYTDTIAENDVLLKLLQRFVVFILFRDSLYLYLEP